MKKAKIMLTAIAVFALIGGTLAFKAKKFTQHLFYRTTIAGGCCTITTFVTLTTIPQAGQIGVLQTTYYTTPVCSSICPTTRVYTVM